MSAPTTHDPLVVNTKDGTTWSRRAVTQDGHGLYAVTDSCKCPEYLLATLAELAERGIVGSAYVLPMPVVPVPQPSERDRLRAAFVAALDEAHKTHPCPVLGDQLWSDCVHYDDAGHVSGVGSCHSGRRADAVLAVRDAEVEFLIQEVDRKSARIAELEAERHTTNEALDDAVQALRAGQSDGCSCPPADHPHQVGCLLDVPAPGSPERPVAALREDVSPQVEKLRALLGGQRVAVEDPHDSPLHHPYRLGHDLPSPDGA